MRNLFLIFLLFMYGNSISQTYAFYRIGQSPTQVESSGLLIRNYKRDLDKLSQLEKYKNLTCFKISGFKDNYEKLDSVLSMLARHTSPRALIFEDCDLMMLSKFEIKTLVKLSLLKNTLFYENSLFPLLKKNPLTTIEIQSSEIPVFDSLGLLKELKEVKLSNRNSFSTVNKTDKLFFKSGDKFINVSISYAGDFFKGEQKNKVPFNTQKINEQVKQTTEMIEQMSALRKLVRTNRPAYLRQPLPEISINDTGFVMDSRNTSYFNYNSGSVIKIDGNAFVTSEDEDYSGPVRIFYREFRNSVDIMLSGVPMNSMVNGEEKLFKSGGMYEIYAFDAKDRPLRARSDTSVKVDFALIDTSNSFQFYSFEPNGQWQVKQQAVSQVVKKKSKNKVKTQAIIEYQKYLNKTSRPDTTSFDARFDSQDYVYLYRKDNLKKSKDSLYDIVSSNYHAVKGFFKIKYVKLTKEKEIVFSIAPVKNASYFMPRYISYITNKKYIYKGELDKEAFRRAFNRKEIFWDQRILSQGEVLSLRLKTNAKYFELLCQVAFQDGEGKYFASGKSTRSLSELIDKGIGRCAKKFNRDPRPHDASGSRYSKFNYNEIDPRKDDYWLAAFRLVEPYKTKDEKKLNFEEWKAYVQTFYSVGEFQRDNDLNTALVKSGMGISNIDAYIHSGAMEEMMVKYDGVEPDSIFQQFNVIMYKSINTSYACVQQDTKALRGFVLKGKPNYIIRFSMNGIMQVTRPSELESFRTEGKISIPYEEQYDVKGLTSTQISSLILDGQN